ncbi:hypothetical protein JCM6882_000412 [Rhodosporidiobolus microsporus]
MAEVFHMIRNRLFPPKPLTSSLDGRVYIVTGGLSGLGYETTLSLALRGATVLCGARNLPRARTALSTLEAAHPSAVGRVRLFEVDLASFAKAKAGAERAVEAVKEAGGRLDGLVNSAGRLILPYEMGEDGWELSVQTNYFSTILFTERLLPLLKETAKQPGSDVRIVTVSSNAGQMAPKSWELKDSSTFNETLFPPGKEDGYYIQFARYGLSKIYIVPYMEDLQRRLEREGSNILAISVNPGGTQTDGTRTMPFPFTLLVPLLFLPTAHGAYNSLLALTSPAVRAEESKYGGMYLEPFGRVCEVPAPRSFAEGETRRRVVEAARRVLVKEGVVF